LAASLITCATLVCAALPVAASNDYLSGGDIRAKIDHALVENGITGEPLIGHLDRHNVCPGEIVVAPLFKSWKTIRVTCPQIPSWRLLVRVLMETDAARSAGEKSQIAQKRSKFFAETTALALRRSMVKGELIQAHDIITVPVSPQQNYGVFHNKADLIGRRIRTPVSAKDPIKSRQLEPRYLVEEGKPVTIAFSTGGIFVEMTGISLQNGQAGELVKVENLSSGKIISGKVIGARKISPIS
jgi:flagella basal body P-ring formation protein FlgA